MKRKLGTSYNEAVSSEWASPGYASTVSSPVRTPVSGKGGRVNGRSKVTKNNKSLPQTPLSISSSPTPLTPASNGRFDNSLGKF